MSGLLSVYRKDATRPSCNRGERAIKPFMGNQHERDGLPWSYEVCSTINLLYACFERLFFSMKKPGLKTRLITGSTGLALMLSMVTSFLFASAGGGVAFAASSHVMSVHPLFRYAGKSTGATKTFSCQSATANPSCYSPQALLKAYGIQRVHDAGVKGKGTSIVIIDAYGDPTVQQDLKVFDDTFNLPAADLKVIAPYGVPTFDINDPIQVDWSGETALDVESAHAVAPEAKIILVEATSSSDQDLENALEFVVDHRLGNVISQSYGEAESCVDPTLLKAQHRTFEKAAAEGISVFASSGDDGAAQPSCDGLSFVKEASNPASDPLVTAVGGTHLDATQTDGTYKSETTWNDMYGATGGGYSTLYSRPSYQRGFVQGKARGIPDVAYSGDVNGGLLISWSGGDPTMVGTIYIFGGTSAGSPQWAAMVDLVDSVFGLQGNINPLLYQFVARTEYSQVFHDITTGNNTVMIGNADGSTSTIEGFDAGTGWDAVTGLGSIDLGNAIFGSGRSCWK